MVTIDNRQLNNRLILEQSELFSRQFDLYQTSATEVLYLLCLRLFAANNDSM